MFVQFDGGGGNVFLFVRSGGKLPLFGKSSFRVSWAALISLALVLSLSRSLYAYTHTHTHWSYITAFLQVRPFWQLKSKICLRSFVFFPLLSIDPHKSHTLERRRQARADEQQLLAERNTLSENLMIFVYVEAKASYPVQSLKQEPSSTFQEKL